MKFDLVTGVYKIICRHQQRTVISELRNGVPYKPGGRGRGRGAVHGRMVVGFPLAMQFVLITSDL
jgi:hypothetical protein